MCDLALQSQRNLPQCAPFTCCSYPPLSPWGPTYWDCTQASGHTESQARSMCSTGGDRWHWNVGEFGLPCLSLLHYIKYRLRNWSWTLVQPLHHNGSGNTRLYPGSWRESSPWTSTYILWALAQYTSSTEPPRPLSYTASMKRKLAQRRTIICDHLILGGGRACGKNSM